MSVWRGTSQENNQHLSCPDTQTQTHTHRARQLGSVVLSAFITVISKNHVFRWKIVWGVTVWLRFLKIESAEPLWLLWQIQTTQKEKKLNPTIPQNFGNTRFFYFLDFLRSISDHWTSVIRQQERDRWRWTVSSWTPTRDAAITRSTPKYPGWPLFLWLCSCCV